MRKLLGPVLLSKEQARLRASAARTVPGSRYSSANGSESFRNTPPFPPRAYRLRAPRGTRTAAPSKGQPHTWAPPGDTRAPAPPRPPRGNGAQPRANESSGISFIQCGAGLLPGKGRGAAPGAGPPRAVERAVPAPRPDQSAPHPGGGGGDQAFFPSARDQSRLYKLELLPPSDERARPRRYPAAPAPGAGAALTLPAPGCPLLPPRPPSQPRTLWAGTLPPTHPRSLGETSQGKTRPRTHTLLGGAENQLGKGEEEAPGLEGARDCWPSA